LGADKAKLIERSWDPRQGTPVFTINGRYASRGWTEWTQGFQYGCAILAFDGTGNRSLLELGRKHTVANMAAHVTHIGVHDHGFHNLSTYGNLRCLMREKRIAHDPWEMRFYDLAIKASACTQAARWSTTAEGGGYVYSFNGPHSLFVDTMRALRILGVAHQLGHVFQGENDQKISLLGRLIQHAETTAKYIVWYGEGRDSYDIRGRTAHEAICNRSDGRFRCPSSQQGFAPFTTWTRGLAWAMLGFAEEIEFLETLPAADFTALGRKKPRFSPASAAPPKPPPISGSIMAPPATASPTGTPALRNCISSAIGKPAPPNRSMITSRSTAPPPPLPPRA